MLLAGHYSCSLYISAASQGAYLTHKFSRNTPGLQSDNVQYPQLPDSFDVDDPDQAGVAHPGELLHGSANAWAAMWFICSWSSCAMSLSLHRSCAHSALKVSTGATCCAAEPQESALQMP